MRTRQIRLAAALAIAALAAPAHAGASDTDALLRVIPSDAPGALIVPDLSRLDANSAAMLGAMEITTASTLFQIMRVMGPFDAIDQHGAAAIVVTEITDAPFLQWPAALILPAPDFDAFARAMHAEGQGPTRTITYNNTPYTLRSAGDAFVIVSPHDIAQPAPDAPPAFSFRSLPAAVTTGADAFLCARAEALRTLAQQQINRAADEAGAAGADAKALDQARAGILAMLDGADSAVLGASFGPLGMKLEAAASWTSGAGSPSPTHETAPGTVARELGAIPDGEFLLLAAGDLASPAVGDALDSLRARAPRVAAGFLDAVDGASAFSLSVYAPDAPLMIAGPLSHALLRWRTDEPHKSLDAFRASLGALGLTAPDGSDVTVGVARARHTHADVPIDEVSLTPAPGPGLFGNAAFVNVFAAGSGDWCALSIEEQPDTLGRSIDGAEPVTSDPVVAQLIELLPDNPSGVALVNVQPLIKQFQPFLMMMLQGKPIPPQIPPAAFAIDSAPGATRVTAFFPAPLLKLSLTLWSANGGSLSFSGAPADEQ